MELNISYHITELKWRVFYGTLSTTISAYVAYLYKTKILYILICKPLLDLDMKAQLVYTSLSEALIAYLKLSFLVGFFSTLPLLILHAYRYLKPGIYENEKRKIKRSLLLGLFFGTVGFFFFWFKIAPILIQFFVGFSSEAEGGLYNVQLMAKLEELVKFITRMTIITALCFGLPGLLAFSQVYLTNIKVLMKYRSAILLGLLFVSALITPPDVISQIFFALPIWFAIEASFLVTSIVKKYKE